MEDHRAATLLEFYISSTLIPFLLDKQLCAIDICGRHSSKFVTSKSETAPLCAWPDSRCGTLTKCVVNIIRPLMTPSQLVSRPLLSDRLIDTPLVSGRSSGIDLLRAILAA